MNVLHVGHFLSLDINVFEHISQQAICPQSRKIVCFGLSMQTIHSFWSVDKFWLVAEVGGITGKGGAEGWTGACLVSFEFGYTLEEGRSEK